MIACPNLLEGWLVIRKHGGISPSVNAKQTWEAVHPELLGRQADAHVAIPTPRNDPYFEVVESTGGRYRVGGAHGCGITVLLSNALKGHKKKHIF